MLEAHITSPRGSLYYAGDAHPYDLEMLWEHLHEASFGLPEGDVRLELIVRRDGYEPPLAEWVRRIEANGVQVQLLFALETAPPADDPRITL